MTTRSCVRALAAGTLMAVPLIWSCSPSDSTLPTESAGGKVGTAGTLGVSGGTHAGAGGSAGVLSVGGGAGTLVSGGTSSGGSAPSGGTSAGGAPAGGASPSGGGGGTNSTGAQPGKGFGGAPADKPDTVEIGVRNNCAFSLWIHGAGDGGVLQPDDQELKTGGTVWYDAPKQWSAARVTAFTDGPRKNELDKVEMTLVNDPGAAGEVLNYNVTYVDWLGLPVEIVSKGGGGDCKPVGCYVKESAVLQGCPSGLLDGKKCQSPRSYCLNPANQATPLCNSLNDEIKKCAQKPGCEGAASATTTEAFACSGDFFSKSPKWCAALNRHTQDSPDSTDKNLYYTTDPYNTYSKWVHQSCPGIYAFAYDDYPSTSGESGFHSCTQGKELQITFCPAG